MHTVTSTSAPLLSLVFALVFLVVSVIFFFLLYKKGWIKFERRFVKLVLFSLAMGLLGIIIMPGIDSEYYHPIYQNGKYFIYNSKVIARAILVFIISVITAIYAQKLKYATKNVFFSNFILWLLLMTLTPIVSIVKLVVFYPLFIIGTFIYGD